MTTGLLTGVPTALLTALLAALMTALQTDLQTAPLSARETISVGGSDDGRVGRQASAEPDVGGTALRGDPPASRGEVYQHAVHV